VSNEFQLTALLDQLNEVEVRIDEAGRRSPRKFLRSMGLLFVGPIFLVPFADRLSFWILIVLLALVPAGLAAAMLRRRVRKLEKQRDRLLTAIEDLRGTGQSLGPEGRGARV
jgi:hypothetical protein